MKSNRMRAFGTLLLAVSGLLTLAMTSPSAQDAPRAAMVAPAGQGRKTVLIQLMNDMAAASVRGDAAFFDRVLGREFIATTINGEVKTKDQILADYRAGAVKFKSHVFDDYTVRFYGPSLAVVLNRAKAVQIYKGKERTGLSRNMRVWAQRQGQWVCVAFQSTRIP